MPRTARKAPGGVVFHCLNRGVGRGRIFHKPQDYAAFERVMAHALGRVPVRLPGYCLMPNHWPLVLRPENGPAGEGQLGRFMHDLTVTHARRYQEHYRAVGHGHLYQGRFKSFPVQEDAHFLTVARYVERNALRAGLVAREQDWPWSSLWRRLNDGTTAEPAPVLPVAAGLTCGGVAVAGAETAGVVEAEGAGEAEGQVQSARPVLPLSAWPVPARPDWVEWVNAPATAAEEEGMRLSIVKGRPFGDEAWQMLTAPSLGLQSACRETGRPRKHPGQRPGRDGKVDGAECVRRATDAADPQV